MSIELSDYQQRVLGVPEEFDLFLGGGRGSGKSQALAYLALRHVEQYGRAARVLYIRRSYKALADFEFICHEILGAAYGKAARYNASDHLWRFPSGATMELGQLESNADYLKYQGRSFTLLLVDEAGHFPTPDLIDRLRSNLRSPSLRPRVVLAANPGDAGHAFLSKRYVMNGHAPWTSFTEEATGRECVCCPGTYLDNPHIDQEAYRRNLEASCPTDPELLRAWLEGDWAIARGTFFAGVLSEKRVAFGPWTPEEFNEYLRIDDSIPHAQRLRIKPPEWDLFLAHDFGVSAPSATYVMAESAGATGPDGIWYPRGSLLVLDELATNVPGQLDVGLGWTVPQLAEAIVEMCGRWKMEPDGVADDAIFARTGSSMGSIAEEFRRSGVYFEPAHKGDRIGGWQVMRRLLQDAGKPDVPGLYISRTCSYLWDTLPYVARCPKRAEDVDSRGPDHKLSVLAPR